MAIEYRELKIYRVTSAEASVTWDDTGKNAHIHFLEDDLTAICVTMPKGLLENLGRNIARAISEQSHSTLPR